MDLLIILALLVCGMALLVLELVVIPGTTVVGIGGIALTVWGLVRVYAEYGTVVGSLVLGLDIILCVILLVYSLKSGTWKKLAQNEEIDSKVNEIKTAVNVGDTGKSVTRLAPMGTAMINGGQMEVYAETAFVDPDTEITVVQVEGNRIKVKPVNN
ncbi:MAG: hypothetical protein IJ759_01615 [Bacteroidales bacterium]|nr:hypothetical protein [Bacteroidales bacterium]